MERESPDAMRRLFIGICSLVLIIAGAVVWTQGASANHHVQVTAAGCVRAGLLLGAVWLAWPQTAELYERVPRWVGMTLLGCLLVVVFRPKLIVIVAPLLAALLVLHWLGLLLRPAKSKKPRLPRAAGDSRRPPHGE